MKKSLIVFSLLLALFLTCVGLSSCNGTTTEAATTTETATTTAETTTTETTATTEATTTTETITTPEPETTVSEEEWHNAFNRTLENGTIKVEVYNAPVSASEDKAITVGDRTNAITRIYKWSGASLETITVKDEGNTSIFQNTNKANGFALVEFNEYFKGIDQFVEFSTFTYDPDTKAYVYYEANDDGTLKGFILISIEDGFITRLLHVVPSTNGEESLFEVHDHVIYDLETTVLSNAQ